MESCEWSFAEIFGVLGSFGVLGIFWSLGNRFWQSLESWELWSLWGPWALGIFGLQKMPLAGARTQDLSASSDLEAFRYRFFGLNTLGASHKCLISSKERVI